MYFVVYGSEQYWQYACDTELANNAYSEWQSELMNSVEAVQDESGMNTIGR